MRKMVKEFTDLPLKYNVKDLVGKPDIVVAGLKLVVFVDGCFWHGCPEHGKIPKSHQGFWRSKIVGNMIRDEENTVVLEEAGWSVWRVWEHDLRLETVAKTRRRLGKKMVGLLNS